MTDLERLSFSIEKPLLDCLNKLVKSGGYANRSEYIRDLIRAQLVKEQWDRNQEVVGAITLVYTLNMLVFASLQPLVGKLLDRSK